MKILNKQKRYMKFNNNIKIVFIMTLIIFGVLIVLSLIFLNSNSKSINIFDLDNKNIVKNSKVTFPMNGKVRIYRKAKDKVEEIDLEEYVMGVVSGEMPANFDEEALKAQAVAARTYYINGRNNPSKEAKEKGAEISDTVNSQVYMSKSERMDKWSSKEKEINWSKIEKAVLDTKGQVLTYDGTILKYPQFFAVSSGKTEDAKDVFSVEVPYLKPQESKGEEIAPKYKSVVNIPINDFVNKINEKYKNSNIKKSSLASLVRIDSYTEAGNVKEIKIGNITIKGTEFRELFNLNSTNFTLKFDPQMIKVDCIGYGHDVGMSQWGANVMAKNGIKYDEILKHYYSGIEIENLTFE